MAKIPDFTALGPAPVPTQPYMRPFYGPAAGEEIGQGMQEAGAQLSNFGEQDYARSVNLARAQASNAMLDHELQVKGIQQQISDDVTAGKIPWSQASQSYQDQVGKLQQPTIANLDPVGQENFANGVKRITDAGAIDVDGIARAGQRQAFVDQFSAAQDKLSKLAGLPGADITSINGQLASYRPQALAAGIPSNVVDQQIQNFQDRNWFNQAEQRAIAARQSPDGLQELATDLSDPKGFYADKLDADKRTVLMRTVTDNQIVLQNHLEHEQDKAQAKALTAMNQIDEQIASGVPATAQQWNQWGALTKGTPQEADYHQALQDEQTVQQVLREPVAQQFAFVQQKAQQLDSQGGTLRDRADFMRLQTAVNQNVNLMEHDPLQFGAQRNGTTIQPLNFSAIGTPQGQQQLGTELSDRMTTLSAMQKQYGATVQALPLRPEEAAELTGQLDNSAPADRVSLLQNLRSSIGDDGTYQAVLRQIAPHSPVTAIAGDMVGRASPSATPIWYNQAFAPNLSNVDLIMHGEALLNPATRGQSEAAETQYGKGVKGFPMPPETGLAGMRTAFSNAAGDMFQGRPQLADAYYTVFKDAYAGLAAKKGDLSAVADVNLEKQALQVALGNQAHFNGGTYSAPYGMDPSRFSGLVQNAVSSAAKAYGAPADWANRIRGYQLQEIGGLGSGRYMLTSGNAPLVRPDGQGPFIINLHDQYLASRGAKPPTAQPSQSWDDTHNIMLTAK